MLRLNRPLKNSFDFCFEEARLHRLLKNSVFGAQPLKGHLNSKNFRHR